MLYFLRRRLLLPCSVSDAAVAAAALFLILRSLWQHDAATEMVMDACWRYAWSVDVGLLSAYVIVSWLHWLVVWIDGEIVL